MVVVVVAGVEHAEGGLAARVAHEVLAAIVEGRVADVLALTDLKLTCLPVTRPALSMYEGHAAMAVLVGDLRGVGPVPGQGGGRRPCRGRASVRGGGERVMLRLLVAGQ